MENPKIIKSIPKSPKPTVSIIIPVYNNLFYTLQCLESIKLCKENIPFEVIVIDDYSTDGLTNVLVPKIQGLKYRRAIKNRGFVSSINTGAKMAKGKYIYLLNNELTKASRIDIIEVGRDKYFRIDGDVVYDGKSLRKEMLNRGYAIPYDGGTKTNPWCKK